MTPTQRNEITNELIDTMEQLQTARLLIEDVNTRFIRLARAVLNDAEKPVEQAPEAPKPAASEVPPPPAPPEKAAGKDTVKDAEKPMYEKVVDAVFG